MTGKVKCNIAELLSHDKSTTTASFDECVNLWQYNKKLMWKIKGRFLIGNELVEWDCRVGSDRIMEEYLAHCRKANVCDGWTLIKDHGCILMFVPWFPRTFKLKGNPRVQKIKSKRKSRSRKKENQNDKPKSN